MTILANDDGHGIISFNNSEHFLLREPTSVSGLGESVATLYIIRDPPQGLFGTVMVQFTITDANGSLYTDDLTPSSGFVVLEDGVRFKVYEALTGQLTKVFRFLSFFLSFLFKFYKMFLLLFFFFIF